MEKYLISARTFRHAKQIAKENKLKRNEWDYVGQPRSGIRHSLCGRRVSSENKLLGYFNNMEIHYLTEG